MTGRLQDRTAIITGGGSGIGLATVRRFAEEGARVVVVDARTRAAGRRPQEVGGLYVRCDVTDQDQVEAMVAQANETYGSVDVAFNNAGISPPDDDSILDTGLDAWRRVQEVNLTSVYLCCKAVLPYMQRAGPRLDHQHRVVRRRDGRRHLADLLHRQQGRRAGHEPRARGAVRPRGHPGQRACAPARSNTPLLRELFAKDPERAARRLVHIPVGRFADPTEIAERRAVPGQRRVELRHGLDVPGRRRHQRRVRHAALTARAHDDGAAPWAAPSASGAVLHGWESVTRGPVPR